MATGYLGFDPSAAAGSKFPSAAARAEIEGLATGDPGPEGIDTSRLATASVTRPKIAPDAVGADEIDAGAVETANLAEGSVSTSKLADNSVTPAKAGTGVVTSFDKDGNAVEIQLVKMTAAQYTVLPVKDPNTYYFVSA